MIDILRHMRYVSVDSSIFRILAQFNKFMYMKTCSEPMAYSGIFRTVDIFCQFEAHYSGITHEHFMHIPKLIYDDSGIFKTPTYLGT